MNTTKKLIAETFLSLCDIMPIEKITISQLIKHCSISKPTFYNHFKDKYDLIAWIFTQDINQAHTNTENLYCLEELTRVLNHLHGKRSFYRKALSLNEQNSLIETIHKHNMDYNSNSIKEFYKVDKLTDEMLFALKYHSYGCIGYVIDWLKDDTPITPEELALLEYQYMPPILKKAWNNGNL